jgi:hypothetical protein
MGPWKFDGSFLGGLCQLCFLMLEALNGAAYATDTLLGQMLGVVNRTVTPHRPQYPYQTSRQGDDRNPFATPRNELGRPKVQWVTLVAAAQDCPGGLDQLGT